ncbi:MAG: hypothetical protein VR68_02450 [Peptococcaceae bacterium BRH_c4a]|nr:MAG: hypothetical protein VR68_02450 [Peptococcaceae bacterium BRH_c4a]
MKRGNFLKKFLPQKTDYIAVDVGTRQTKIAHVNSAGETPMVISLESVNTPEGMFRSDAPEDQLNRFLTETFEENGIKGKEVIVCMTGDRVITRYVLMPRLTDKELAKAIQVEAANSIPVPMSNLSLRHVRLDGEGEQQTQRIMIAAAPTDVVLKYYDLFSRAGTRISVMDHAPLALWRVCFGMGEMGMETAAAIDIGASYTNIIVSRDQRLVFSRTLPVGGDIITRSMAETYSMEFDEAQKYKEERAKILTSEEAAMAFNPEDMQIDFSLRDGLSELTREIRRSIEYFNSQSGGNPVQRLIFSGGTAKLKGFIDFIADALEVPAGLLKFPVIHLDGQGQDAPIDPSYAVAVGLALRGARQFQ